MTAREVSLAGTGKWRRLSLEEIKKWREIKEELEARQAAGLPIFVKLSDKRREGSIGKLVSLNIQDVTHPTSSRYSSNSSISFEDMEVRWDGRSNKVRPLSHEVTLLLDHPVEVGTIWSWNPEASARPKKDPVTVQDALGQEVEPGQIVGFVHKYYGGTSLKFGTVTRMTKAGTVFVQTLKLKDGQRSEEVRCYYNSLVIVNDKLMNRLMMAKLAAN